MCVACIEYTKGTLNLGEFQSALRETTIEDQEHAKAVAKILRDFAGNEVEIKKQLEALAKTWSA